MVDALMGLAGLAVQKAKAAPGQAKAWLSGQAGPEHHYSNVCLVGTV
jgi:hypothetical protein